ncbi:UMP-CMP kinase 2, mitochondrial isoform X1 [Protopterus annectens]|uniref:UMP-CMP kinase 2, mitochondrial isoform X1 n=1 Tax=Protopterus annectens TaxID=7888 RepID=UPI001CFAD938|nr:UMP-CMP kinase 2, mitochondrial isoform X1 [Protopterus annectens]
MRLLSFYSDSYTSLEKGFLVQDLHSSSETEHLLKCLLLEHEQYYLCTYDKDSDGCIWQSLNYFRGKGSEIRRTRILPVKGVPLYPYILNSSNSAVFYTFAGACSVLRECKEIIPEVKGILDLAGQCTIKAPKGDFPVIVIEGLDATGKSTLCHALKDRLNAFLLKSPPSCLSQWRKTFDEEPTLIKRAFYALGNYIAACEIATLSCKAPVIIDRVKFLSSVNSMSFSKSSHQDISLKKELQTLLSTIQDLSTKIDKLDLNLENFKEKSSQQMETIHLDLRQQKEQINGIETSLNDMDSRIQVNEHNLESLLKQNSLLSAKIDDLENRSRRNNIRIFGLPENVEDNNMEKFLTSWLPEILQLPEALSYGIERAHRSLSSSKINKADTTRSVIVRFLSSYDKEIVLKTAWSKSPIKFKDNVIQFDNDYSSSVIARRKLFLPLLKELKKETQIKTHLVFPAKLKIFLQGGPKIFDKLEKAIAYIKSNKILDDMDWASTNLKRLVENGSWKSLDHKKKLKKK